LILLSKSCEGDLSAWVFGIEFSKTMFFRSKYARGFGARCPVHGPPAPKETPPEPLQAEPVWGIWLFLFCILALIKTRFVVVFGPKMSKKTYASYGRFDPLIVTGLKF